MRKLAVFLFVVFIASERVAAQFALPVPNENLLACNILDTTFFGDCEPAVETAVGLSSTLTLTAPFTVEMGTVSFQSGCGAFDGALFWYGNSSSFFYSITSDQTFVVRVRTANGGAITTFTLGTNPIALASLSVAANGAVTAFFSAQANTNVAPVTGAPISAGTFPVIANAQIGVGAPVGFPSGTTINGVRFTGFNGVLVETRIWNFAKSAAQVQADAFAVVSGKEPGLTNLWRYRNGGVADVGGVNFAVPANVKPIQIVDFNFNTRMFLYTSARESAPANLIDRRVFNAIINDINLPINLVHASSPNIAICAGVVNNCLNLAPIGINTVTSSLVTFTTQFTRASCTAAPGTVSLLPVFVPATNGSITFAQQFIFEFPVTEDDISINIPDTSSLIQLVSSVQIGLNGAFASGESITFTIRNQTIPCVAVSVPSVFGQTIVCDNFGLPGEGNATIVLCERTFVKAFAFPPPQVLSVIAVSAGVFNVTGVGFGIPRNGDPVFDAVSMRDGASVVVCSSLIESDTKLVVTCVAENLVIGNDYTLVVAMGAPVESSPFNYQICALGCQNGGICIAENTCQCPANFVGDQCQTEAANILAIAIPVSVGGAALIVAGIAGIIAYRRYKNPKRGGKTFVPLEKKDFTKIIYGDTLLTNPSGKAPGDLLKLETLLLEDNLELAFAIANATQITEADEIAKALVTVFQANNKVLPLLKAFVGEEVRNSDSAGTLFRSNSFVSKMFKFYSRLVALPYLYMTIGPEINELLEDKLGLEVDPEKIEEGTDLDQMRWTLMAQSQKILKQIMASNDSCPNEFKVLFSHLKECVAEKFPEHVNITIGGFIFLRFFCPAISSPEAYGLNDEPPSQECRRLLILITKVLQNLSNDVEFGSKEMYMTKMNDFIQVNRGKIATFYKKMIDSASDASTPVDMPRTARNAALHILGNHLKDVAGKFTDESSKKKATEILN